MKVILLAAGVGRRLDSPDARPKALLQIGDRSLLERHMEILRSLDLTDVSIVVGHRAELIAEEIARIGLSDSVRLIENPHYREGSVVSLCAARDVLASGDSVVFMDADVLYDYRVMARLLESPLANCFLLDRNIEPGDEPVKICVRDDVIVDFRKKPQFSYDWHGEWIGFVRFSAPIALELAGRVADYVGGNRRLIEYEEPMRDMILAHPPGTFGFEDITGLPWIEIDFPKDLQDARNIVLPQLVERPADPLMSMPAMRKDARLRGN